MTQETSIGDTKVSITAMTAKDLWLLWDATDMAAQLWETQSMDADEPPSERERAKTKAVHFRKLAERLKAWMESAE